MSLAQSVKEKFPNLVKDAYNKTGDEVVVIKKESVTDILRSLKEDAAFGFNMLMDLFGVDYLFWEEKENRFEVLYNLFSSSTHRRLIVKAEVPETDATMDSVTKLWPAADWYEREVWDMFGIQFKGHPNLKRILMYESFQGHALRKDYPYNKRQPLIGPLN